MGETTGWQDVDGGTGELIAFLTTDDVAGVGTTSDGVAVVVGILVSAVE